jgi:uncharacterized protein (DUF433 family)
MSTPATLPDSTFLSRYVTRDPEILQGEPIVAGTQVAVRDIVTLWQSGMRPEEITQRLYDLVTIAQVFDALSFYYDTPEEIDEKIEWYKSHQLIYSAPDFKHNPLWDDVLESIATYRHEVDVALGENSL